MRRNQSFFREKESCFTISLEFKINVSEKPLNSAVLLEGKTDTIEEEKKKNMCLMMVIIINNAGNHSVFH